MDEWNLADLVREISQSVQQTVNSNSKTFVEIRRTVGSTVKGIKDTVLETVDTVKNTAAHPKTPPKPAPYPSQWVDNKLMKRSAPGKITGLLLALLGAVPGLRDPAGRQRAEPWRGCGLFERGCCWLRRSIWRRPAHAQASASL